MLARFLFF